MWKPLAERGRTTSLILILVMALAMMSVKRVDAQQATVYLSPATYTVSSVGSTYTVNISVRDVENLYAWALKLYYPNDILSGTNAAEGSFLKAGGVSTFFDVHNFTDNYNATHGLLNVLCSRTSDVPGVSGSGTLATITFKCTSTDGPKTLHLADVNLIDPTPAAIPFTAEDGEVTVIPEFPAALILPLLIVSTLAAITLGKRIRNHRAIFHIV
jgi:hypothetical protein